MPRPRSQSRPSLQSLPSLLSLLSLLTLVPLALGACLPSSRRGETRSLLPSDSLSRRIAAGAPVDTLQLLWRSANEGMQLPTSIAWLTAAGGPGRLVVADTRAGALRLFDAASGAVADPGGPTVSLAYPYLAGAQGDTAVVLVRGEDRLSWIDFGAAAGREVRTVPVPAGA